MGPISSKYYCQFVDFVHSITMAYFCQFVDFVRSITRTYYCQLVQSVRSVVEQLTNTCLTVLDCNYYLNYRVNKDTAMMTSNLDFHVASSFSDVSEL